MKTIHRIIHFALITASALLIIAAKSASAQTNAPPTFTGGLQEMASAVSSSTNWTIVGGAGRGLTGNKNLAFGAVAYNFNENVGLLVGMDTLWTPSGAQPQQNNVVKGGITLSAPIHPFAFIGSSFLTNVVGTPFALALATQPSGGSSDSIGTVAGGGINFDIVSFKNFELVAGAEYESRSGAGYWNGNYALIHFGIGRRF
jgi:hypothetical protein